MRRTWSFWLVLFFFAIVFPLAAQEDPDSDQETEAPPIEWDTYMPDLYRAGDKNFCITAGILIPTFFTGKGMDNHSSNLKVGGNGALSFNYFLNAHLFLGGEFGGMFMATGGRNFLFAIPFGLRLGYQFVMNRFEFPVSLMVGAAPELYLEEKRYWGVIFKPGASIFYRFNPDWSFGFNVQWWMLPQWPKNGKNVLGNFLELSLTARYHF